MNPNSTLLRSLGFLAALALLCPASESRSPASSELTGRDLAEPITTPGALLFRTLVDAELRLTVVRPDGERVQRVFPAGTTPGYLIDGSARADGLYRWELRSVSPTEVTRSESRRLVQSGTFFVEGGVLLEPGLGGLAPEPLTTMEDTFIGGNLAAGTSVDGTELFVDTTLLLKEPVLRVVFEDDDAGGGQVRDWSIVVNDVAGGADYFAIDDMNASTRPFYIAGTAPTSALHIAANGAVGLGTSTPDGDLDLQTTGNNARFVIERSDGTHGLLAATATIFSIGATNDVPVQWITNNSWRIKVFTDNSLLMRSGASCTTGGVWTNNSALASQQNVRPLTEGQALAALAELEPVLFRYRAEPGTEHVGFTAEHSPDLLVTDRGGMSAMDVTAVLTRVVQHQREELARQRRQLAAGRRALAEQREVLAGLRRVLAEQDARLAALEAAGR